MTLGWAKMSRMSNPATALREARNRDGFERWTNRTETPLLVLAVLFLVVLIAPYVVTLNRTGAVVLLVLNIVIWAAFALDYFVRLYLARERWRFVKANLLDLLIVVLPMLRPLRALRLLRILRLGSIAGIAHKRATHSLHARVTTYVVTAVVVSVLAAAGAVREAERGSPDANIKTLGDGLWWAATTVTTVGYGDRYPTTMLGRFVAVALMLLGIALLGVITATIAAWFVERLQDVEETVAESEQRTEATLDEVLRELRELRRMVEGPR